MQINRSPNLSIGLLAFLLAMPGTARPQAKEESSRTQRSFDLQVSDTTEGLQKLIEEVLSAAKKGDEEKVTALVKNMEIPNCDAWLHKMYRSDKADSWMGLCDPKVLVPHELSMQKLFMRLGTQSGAVSARKVNDNPEHGMESAWLTAIRQPLDIYFVSWKVMNPPKDYGAEPIGYFMYIDGGFRWESGIVTVRPSDSKNTAAIVVYKLITSVPPIYPPEAISQGIEGTVRVRLTIGIDGTVSKVYSISGEGLSNDASLRKAAEEAVLQWRYQPMTFNGNPVAVETTAEVSFALKK